MHIFSLSVTDVVLFQMPGVATKRDGVLDVSMFSTEEDVRGHLLRHLHKHDALGSGSTAHIDTDTDTAGGWAAHEDAEHLVLTEWSLSTHRSKRIRPGASCGGGGDVAAAAHRPSGGATTTIHRRPHSSED